jgi:hypothetical protein
MNFRSYLIIGGILGALAGLSKLAKAGEYFEMDFPPADKSMVVYSWNSPKIRSNWDIGAFYFDPNTKDIYCSGEREDEDKNDGRYGFLSIYGDDETTPIKDGASLGDHIHFLVHDGNELYVCKTDPNVVVFDPYVGPVEVNLEPWIKVPWTWPDLANALTYYLQPCGSQNQHCGWSDLNGDGIFDLKDFAIIADNWDPNFTWADVFEEKAGLPADSSYWAGTLGETVKVKDPDNNSLVWSNGYSSELLVPDRKCRDSNELLLTK